MIEPSDDMLRRWLLHSLPQQEAARLEERLLQDGDFAAHLRAVEIDLLDDCVRDRLSAADRDAVSNRLLATPEDRERLRIALALAQVDATSARSPRAAQANRHAVAASPARWPLQHRRAVAGGLLASACAVLILAVGVYRHDQIETPVMHAAADAVATITLLADQQRGAQREEIRIPHGAATIRLQVEVNAAAQKTRYTLSIADGTRTVFSAQDLAPHEAAPYHFVEVTLAVRALASGAHRVRVSSQGAFASETTWSIRTRNE